MTLSSLRKLPTVKPVGGSECFVRGTMPVANTHGNILIQNDDAFHKLPALFAFLLQSTVHWTQNHRLNWEITAMLNSILNNQYHNCECSKLSLSQECPVLWTFSHFWNIEDSECVVPQNGCHEGQGQSQSGCQRALSYHWALSQDCKPNMMNAAYSE